MIHYPQWIIALTTSSSLAKLKRLIKASCLLSSHTLNHSLSLDNVISALTGQATELLGSSALASSSSCTCSSPNVSAIADTFCSRTQRQVRVILNAQSHIVKERICLFTISKWFTMVSFFQIKARCLQSGDSKLQAVLYDSVK